MRVRPRLARPVGLGLAVISAAGAVWLVAQPDRAADPRPTAAPAGADAAAAPADVLVRAPAFVGRAACATCHADEAARWAGSHHDLAMQEPAGAAVLGDFDDSTFRYAGTTTRFFRSGGKPMVHTDGPDGALHDYEVRFAFGVAPLQQYLLDLGAGRLQALSIAWDSRPRSEGGQRWFHLHPKERVVHDDPLHWTRPQQNWNAACADCHSTGVRRDYDPESGGYATRYSEIDVACEACHGPGSRHAAWARREPGWERAADTKGLGIALDERRGVTWYIDAATGNGKRSRPRESTREIDTCAPCHARRGELGGEAVIGAPIGDGYRVALLDDPLYFDDGQIRDEVYEYGSFAQSRMSRAGVTCSDCHEPHALELRAEGSTLCLQCHAADRYRTATHHHHRERSAGAACVACHMPARTYMIVDERRDHSFRIPRPDRTVAIGTPNACNGCHAERTPAWAADQVRAWAGEPGREARAGSGPGFQRFAEALHAGTLGAPGARSALLRVAVDPTEPGIARASALGRIDRIPDAATLDVVRRLLGDVDPLVRRAAASAYGGAPPAALADLLRLCDDPIRDVRLEAARRLALAPPEGLAEPDRRRRERAIDEYLAAQRAMPDRPEAELNLGSVLRDLGRASEAKSAFERALALDPAFAPAAVNLADVLRELGRDAEGEAVLRRALAERPDAGIVHHALGLWLVRAGRTDAALDELVRAGELAPEDPHLAYVAGVALHDAGKAKQARRLVEEALARHRFHPGLLQVMALVERDAGRSAAAERYERRLAEVSEASRGGAGR